VNLPRTPVRHLLIEQQEDTAPPLVVKRPNPQNEKNKATLEELEEEVKRYVQPHFGTSYDVAILT
jgi:hypothetical protein